MALSQFLILFTYFMGAYSGEVPGSINHTRHHFVNVTTNFVLEDEDFGPEVQLSRAAETASAEACQTWLDAPNTYLELKNIYLQLGIEKKDPTTIPYLHCFLPSNATFSMKSPAQMYRYLVVNSFHPSILYYAARNALKYALVEDNRTGHMILAWAGSFAAEASLVGFAKTKELRFLDLYISYFDKVLSRRDDQLARYDFYHKRVMKAWGTTELDNTTWVAFATPNARIVYTATLFSMIVRRNRSLPESYRAKANTYIAIAEETLAEFDQDWKKFTDDGSSTSRASDGTTKWMLMPMGGTFYPLRREPINHVHLIGDAWLNLWQLADNQDSKAIYKQKIMSVLQVFINSVQKGPGGTVHWNYYPHFAKREKKELSLGLRYSENIWKASLTCPFVVRAHRQGFKMPLWLLKAISTTFSNIVFKENQLLRSLSPKESDYFNITDFDLFKAPHIAPLVEWSPTIAKEITTLMGNRPDVFPGAWFACCSNRPLMAYARMM
ncbi:hypothetical protein Ndes2526A_g05414 [Nannochloris sp. 'desiccata']